MMTKFLIVLVAIALTVTMAAATKALWFPAGLQDRWNQAWITHAPDEDTPRTALLSGHTRRMTEMEAYFREMIEKEKARQIGLLAEKAKLSETPATP